MVQKTFQRTEKKYLLTRKQYENIIDNLKQHTHADINNGNRIYSLYFDTDTDLLIRRSIDKPVYKEKLRLRAYGIPDDDSRVFIEIKKKFKKVVYKRRVYMKFADARDFLSSSVIPHGYEDQSQILNEIQWFMHSYEGLRPSTLISYDREAYYGNDNLRITFDTNITWLKVNDFPTSEDGASALLSNADDGNLHSDQDFPSMIMEIKISGAMPLWLVHLLSQNEIYPTSFSKVGTAYRHQFKKGEISYV